MELENSIKNLFPKGSAWNFSRDFDLLIKGMAYNYQNIYDESKNLAFLRAPLLTPLIDELLFEYGISRNPLISEAEQRARLLSISTALGAQGPDYLENRLRLSGFDLNVFEQSIEGSGAAICGEPNATCGEPEAICGSNAQILDPNDLLNVSFFTICGESEAVCGEPEAIMGQAGGDLIVNGEEYDDIIDVSLTPESNYGFIFYIGGENFGDFADVPASRKKELERLILKYKPLHTWCGLFVYYV